jgi:membrane protein implicated in regulation of membrane protease activity
MDYKKFVMFMLLVWAAGIGAGIILSLIPIELGIFAYIVSSLVLFLLLRRYRSDVGLTG